MRGFKVLKLRKLPTRRVKGGNFDFFGLLKNIGNTIQSVIDKAAPITSKLVGPVASALTGVNIPNPSDVISQGPSTLLPALKTIGEKNLDNANLNDKVKDLM